MLSPNFDLKSGVLTLKLIAIRDIAVGEEITKKHWSDSKWKYDNYIYKGGLHGDEIFVDMFVLADAFEELSADEYWVERRKKTKMEQEAKDRAEEAELRRNAPGIPECLKQLFALPNWENRIGPWKDINDAIKQLHAAYTKIQRYTK